MELITRPLTSIVHSILTLPRLLRLVLIIISGFTASTIGALSLGQVVSQPSNPFLEYADFFPGKSESVLQNSPFSCDLIYSYRSTIEKRCNFNPSSGTFSSVGLTVDYNVIVSITFILRDTSVRVGELQAWWETKPVHAFLNVSFFFLPESVIIARTSSHSEDSSLFSPVWSVSITAKDALD
jgi:hypothetical protein